MEPVESPQNLEHFRQIVLEEDHLLERLRQTGDLDSFVGLLVQMGTEHGCRFTPEQVREALQGERRAWLQKWI